MAQEAAPAAPGAKAKAKKPAPAEAGAAAAAAAKDPAVALASYTSGVKSYQAGKFDAAVQSMNAAVNNGGLPSAQLAKALYYRGAAYKQLGKPGQAVSDLTSALWLKGGLDDAERAEASRLRSAAYADAGLTEQGQAATSRSTVADAGGITTGSLTPQAGPQLNAVPAESGAAAPDGGLGGIGKLFGNLFGGGSSQPQVTASPAPAPAQSAAAVAAPTSAPAATVPAASGAEVLPWAGKPVALAAAAPEPATAPAAAVSPAAAKAPAAKKAGSYRIQVAAVKTRDEASAVIAKLQGIGGTLAATPAAVDETTFGAMGTYYRVRLGPYASAAETKAPCTALKASGLDCLVTAK
jgi:tetratricopeptide (TPR) repeat protein